MEKSIRHRSLQNSTISVPLTAKVRDSEIKSNGSDSATSGAESWYNPHNRTAAKVQVFENEINIIFQEREIKHTSIPKRKKNDIKRFSKKSRFRVFKKFNRLQTKKLGKPIFITCTAKTNMLTPEQFEYAFLKRFLPRLKKIIPQLVYAWRLEFHKSGYPHYHLFAWSFEKERKLYSNYYHRLIRAAWRTVIEDETKAACLYSCKIKAMNDERKVFSYVSKYTAKEEDIEHAQKTGRRWGISTNFPAKPITEQIISYQDAYKIVDMMKTIAISAGRDPELVEKYVNTEGETCAWMPLNDIYKLLRDCNIPILPTIINFYIRTGETAPTDKFFELYADYLE